jgi:hypothetical protein
MFGVQRPIRRGGNKLINTLKYKTMIEAIASGLIALLIFAFGYGRLAEKLDNQKEINDSRHFQMNKEIDTLKKTYEVLNKMSISIALIEQEIKKINENLKQK